MHRPSPRILTTFRNSDVAFLRGGGGGDGGGDRGGGGDVSAGFRAQVGVPTMPMRHPYAGFRAQVGVPTMPMRLPYCAQRHPSRLFLHNVPVHPTPLRLVRVAVGMGGVRGGGASVESHNLGAFRARAALRQPAGFSI